MNEIHAPQLTALEVTEQIADTSRDMLIQKQNIQLELAFDRLAETLAEADWPKEIIDQIFPAIYHGGGAAIEDITKRLGENLQHAELKDSEIELWNRWTNEEYMSHLVETYNDPERHSAHHLRLRLSNLVSKIANKTY